MPTRKAGVEDVSRIAEILVFRSEKIKARWVTEKIRLRIIYILLENNPPM